MQGPIEIPGGFSILYLVDTNARQIAIYQASGGSEFNEVYFTDLRVKDSQRLGAVTERDQADPGSSCTEGRCPDRRRRCPRSRRPVHPCAVR